MSHVKSDHKIILFTEIMYLKRMDSTGGVWWTSSTNAALDKGWMSVQKQNIEDNEHLFKGEFLLFLLIYAYQRETK